MSDFTGKVIIICAPSGSGKTTILQAILPQMSWLGFSVSATSRSPRPGEAHGKDYYFLSETEFRQKIELGEFLEWEEVYKGSFYGTLKSEVYRIWSMQKHVIFDVDVLGGVNIKNQFGDKALSVFIMPPSVDELAKRLSARGTETPQSLASRIQRAEYELSFAAQFDVRVINDQLEKAIEETATAIKSFLATQTKHHESE